MSYAIRFDFPDDWPEPGQLFAGMYKGAFGWAPTLATALLYDDEETAQRVLANGYGSAAKYGSVVLVDAKVGA